jgi:hypothetical protein
MKTGKMKREKCNRKCYSGEGIYGENLKVRRNKSKIEREEKI